MPWADASESARSAGRANPLESPVALAREHIRLAAEHALRHPVRHVELGYLTRKMQDAGFTQSDAPPLRYGAYVTSLANAAPSSCTATGVAGGSAQHCTSQLAANIIHRGAYVLHLCVFSLEQCIQIQLIAEHAAGQTMLVTLPATLKHTQVWCAREEHDP